MVLPAGAQFCGSPGFWRRFSHHSSNGAGKLWQVWLIWLKLLILMPKAVPLVCSAEDMRRLTDLLRAPPVHLSEEKQLQLRILSALCADEPPKRIAAREKITTSYVSKIRKKAAGLTLAVFMDGTTKQASRVRKKAAGTRASAGNPGHEDIHKWAAKIPIKDEAVFELATLILTPEVQIATIAVREGHLYDYNAAVQDEKRSERFAEAGENVLGLLAREVHLAARTPIFWTRLSMQDTLLEEIFHRLNEHFGRLMPQQEGGSPIPAAKSLKDRFSSRFRHLVLSSGPEEMCRAEVEKITAGVQMLHLRANSKIGFLRHLEAALHHRRLTKSCAGFLPMTSRLCDVVRQLPRCEMTKPWLWQVEETEVLEFLKVHILTQDYFAARGILIGTNSFLWPKIPYQDEISFRTLPVSTRLEVDRVIVQGFFRVVVTPMPNLSYQVRVPWEGSEKAFLKRARKLFERKSESRRFIYSTRRPGAGSARASIVVPDDFLVGKGSKKVGKGQGVALLPRHFFIAEPEIAMEKLAALAVRTAQGVSVSNEEKLLGSVIVFHAPYIEENILRNIGTYWDRLEELDRWQDSLSECAEEDARSPCGTPLSDLFLKLRPEAVLEKDVWDKFIGCAEMPTVEQIEAEVKKSRGEPVTAQGIQSLLIEKLIPKLLREVTPEALLDAVTNLSSDTGRAALAQNLSALELILGAELGEEKMSGDQSEAAGAPREPNPIMTGIFKRLDPLLVEELMRQRETRSPDSRQDFENILKQLDADYLIRSLDKATRNRFERDAKKWARECEKVIAAEYWPSGSLEADTVRSLVEILNSLKDADFKNWWERNKAEVDLLGDKARRQFLHSNSRFATRKLVETMQRCVLGRVPAVPLAVESTASVLRRWRALLRAILNRKLAALKAREDKTTEAAVLDEGEPPEIHPDADSYEELPVDKADAFDDDVKEICDLVRSLRQASENGFRRFFAFANKFGWQKWRGAIRELDDAAPGGGWMKRISGALKLCRDKSENPAGGGPSKALLEKLRQLFAKS